MPRHRFLGYRGSIRVDFIDNPISVLHRARFWEWAEATLVALDIPADVWAAIEAALESRVPRETEAAVAKKLISNEVDISEAPSAQEVAAA